MGGSRVVVSLLGVLVIAGCGGCGDAHHRAHLQHANGLEEGAPVYLAGVHVGDVESVAIEGDDVEVEFVIESEHDVTLHADACAFTGRLHDRPALVVVAGERGEHDGETALPPCDLGSQVIRDMMRGLGEAFREMMRQLGAGVGPVPPIPPMPNVPGMPGMPNVPRPPTGSGPGTPPFPPMPSLPGFGPPPSGPTPCDAMTVSVERVEPVAPDFFRPNGGHRAWLVFRNGNEQSIEVGPVTEAVLADRDRRALAVADAPQGDDWFMPFDVPARGERRVSVVVSGGGGNAPELDSIEFRVLPGDAGLVPLVWCTGRQDGMAR